MLESEQYTKYYDLIELGFAILKNGEFGKAEATFEEVLDNYSECALAYMGKLFVHYKVKTSRELADLIIAQYFQKTDSVRVIDYDVTVVVNSNCEWASQDVKNRIIAAFSEYNTVFYNCAIDSMKEYDANHDYMYAFCALDDSDDGVASMYYKQFLQYATNEEKAQFDVLGIIGKYVESELEEETAELERRKALYSKENLLTILERIKTQYGDIKDNNSDVNEAYMRAVAEYEAQVNVYNQMIAEYEKSLASLTGLFKGKIRSEINQQIEAISAKRDNLIRPTMADAAVNTNLDEMINIELRKAGVEIDDRKVVVLGSYNGEPIEWIVLDSIGNEALLISKKVLAAAPYNACYNEDRGTRWEESTIRQWLNNDFIAQALADYENKIKISRVIADKSPEFGTESGNDTEDKVFLLSIEEAKKYFNIAKYDAQELSDVHYIGYATGFATEMEIKANDTSLWCYGCDDDDECEDTDADYGSCCWWLRTPGESNGYAACIANAGYVDYEGYHVSSNHIGVRPAMWISLE